MRNYVDRFCFSVVLCKARKRVKLHAKRGGTEIDSIKLYIGKGQSMCTCTHLANDYIDLFCNDVMTDKKMEKLVELYFPMHC